MASSDLTSYPFTSRWWDRVISLMSPQRYTSFTSFEGSINSSALLPAGELSFNNETPIKLKDLKSPVKSPLQNAIKSSLNLSYL